VRTNTGLDVIDQAWGVNKKQDEIIVNNDDKDNTRGNLVQGECVKKDRVDHF
jgi:hypothetical protein